MIICYSWLHLWLHLWLYLWLYLWLCLVDNHIYLNLTEIQYNKPQTKNNQNTLWIMKQRCWKQLKNQLCPPERWVKDSEHSKCQCCSKQFRLLVRRRHHCRFCGNLFCSECSDYFINGNYIGDNNEKYIRHCQFCHKKIEKFIKEWTKMPEVYEEKNVQNNKEEQDLTEDEEDQKQLQFNLNKMFQEAEKSAGELNEILGERMTRILVQSSEALCDKFGIDKQIWKYKIKDLALRASNETKMEVLVSENSVETAMDIAKRVKVKSLQSDGGNKGVQALVKGIVLQKNTATKSMQTHLSNPKVLIIQNSIDLDSLASFIKFEQLIKNDKAIMKKILQKILKLNPDIIFVENNVHVIVLQYLQSKQIVVVNKLKQRQIEMIKQITGIKKTIKKLWMLEKYKHHCILGKCDKIYFKNAREGQMLMFMESAEMGIRTILIGDQNEDQTNNLKKSVQIIMRLARQLNLQKHFILIEKQLKDGIGKKECILPVIEDFTPSVYSNIENFIINQEICFSKVLYSPVKLSQSPKNFQQYAHRFGKTSYKQMCGKVEFLTKKIYTSTDFTLGAYILMAAANFERPCKKCQNNHKEQYYIEDHTVSIETEKKNSTAVTKSSSASFIEIKDEQFTLQKLKNHLTKQKQLIVISTHASCQICGNVVGVENVKVGKLFLSNSFHHIIHSLVVAYETTVLHYHDNNEDDKMSSYSLSQVSRKLSRRKLSIDRCEHSILTRVYEYAGILIKISIQPTRPSFVDYIDLTRKQSIEHIKVKQNKFLKKMYEHELTEKTKLLQKIVGLLSALPFPTMSASVSMSPNPKVMQCYDNAMKLKEILQKCRVQLKQVEVKSAEELEKPKHDWTIQTRRILKVESILQMAILIIDELQRILRKKKNEEVNQNQNQNQNQNMEPSVILQNNELNHLQVAGDQTTDVSVIINPNLPQSETYLDEQTREYLKSKSKKIFPRTQGTFIHFHTANINDPVSLLACCLNSSAQYRRFCEEETNNVVEFKFKINGYKRLKTDWALRAETDKIYTEVVGEISEKLEVIQITVFYQKQFEAFRKREGIDNELYMRGLCTCRSWDSSGGKSNSLFAKAQNDLLVVKVINEKQFDQFLKFAKDYIKYLNNSKKVGRDTLLAKIFGIYEVSVKGKIYKCVVMQNIFFGLQTIDKVYDLKGSEVNRLNMPPEGVKSFTGQDTNFKIDKQGEPYVLRGLQFNRIISVLEQDSTFLKQNSVIDYSLLVIESKNTLRLGVIDYMRPYQLMQKIETIYKEFKSGRDPTVIPPCSYAQRFVAAMKRYFIKSQ